MDDGCKITSVKWGEIQAGGKTFRDLIVGPGVLAEWDWSQTDMHHSPGVRDVDIRHALAMCSTTPDVIVIGSGFEGKLRVSADLISKFEGIGFVAAQTPLAVRVYDQLPEDCKVLALLHSTC